MSKRVQFIRHATGAADAFVGLQGELTVDTTKKELRVHDGLTAGGIPHARADLANVAAATPTVDGKLVAADKQKLDFLTLTQAADLDAIEIDAAASKVITDWIAVTQPVNLDTIESDVAANVTELALIAISQNVNLDTMESDIALNNAKITNATHTGDATGSTALTIAANAVTLAKMADMATARILGRVTAATGDPEALTGTQVTTLINIFTDLLKGLVPASGGGTTNFLRADGTWSAPPAAPLPTQVTNHIRAGNVQIDDASSAPSNFILSSNIVEDAYESVGPTGSGANNIWTAMDALPTEATILIVDVRVLLDTGAGATSAELWVANGDVVSPSVANGRVSWWQWDFDADVVGNQDDSLSHVLIPLGPTNQDFKMRWGINGETSGLGFVLYYKGFMTDT